MADGMLTGHQHGPRWRACGGHIIVGVSECITLSSDGVDVGRLDLGPEAAAVAETKVICHDNEEVWAFLRHRYNLLNW